MNVRPGFWLLDQLHPIPWVVFQPLGYSSSPVALVGHIPLKFDRMSLSTASAIINTTSSLYSSKRPSLPGPPSARGGARIGSRLSLGLVISLLIDALKATDCRRCVMTERLHKRKGKERGGGGAESREGRAGRDRISQASRSIRESEIIALLEEILSLSYYSL